MQPLFSKDSFKLSKGANYVIELAGAPTLKKFSATHVIKLGFAPMLSCYPIRLCTDCMSTRAIQIIQV